MKTINRIFNSSFMYVAIALLPVMLCIVLFIYAMILIPIESIKSDSNAMLVLIPFYLFALCILAKIGISKI